MKYDNTGLKSENSCFVMEPTSLDSLLQTGKVKLVARGLEITVSWDWIIFGENRLSYTTLTRLVECCREYHWKIDMEPVDKKLDSTVKVFSAQFDLPVYADSVVYIIYKVGKIGAKSYELLFEIIDKNTTEICANFKLLSVFIDPLIYSSITPSIEIKQVLSNLHQQYPV